LIIFAAKIKTMFSRKLLSNLQDHLQEKQITVITGMRRVGKTSLLKMLMAGITSENKLYVDLERIENRIFFSQHNYRDIEIGLHAMGLNLSAKAYLFIDEIQLVPGITSIIKVLYDEFEVKIVVTGSSSFYLKNRFSESLAGRKRIFELYPLNFKEYLHFKGLINPFSEEEKYTSFNMVIYNQLKEHYDDYIKFGGFPEVVLSDSTETKEELLKDIINSYIELDIKLLSDFSISNDLYKLIRLLAARTGSRIDYSKLSSVSGLTRSKVKEYLELLSQTYIIYLLKPFTKNIDREIVSQHKVYFADTGLARIMGCESSGPLLENTVLNQLIAFGELRYYANKSGQEIDFIINGETCIEVKETASESDLKILSRRSNQIGLLKFHLVCKNVINPDFKDFIWAGNL
jgi:uncharacterized protein